MVVSCVGVDGFCRCFLTDLGVLDGVNSLSRLLWEVDASSSASFSSSFQLLKMATSFSILSKRRKHDLHIRDDFDLSFDKLHPKSANLLSKVFSLEACLCSNINFVWVKTPLMRIFVLQNRQKSLHDDMTSLSIANIVISPAHLSFSAHV